MRELQLLGMQHQPSRLRGLPSVARISHNRRAHRSQVHPDLMLTSGRRLRMNEKCCEAPVDDADLREGLHSLS